MSIGDKQLLDLSTLYLRTISLVLWSCTRWIGRPFFNVRHGRWFLSTASWVVVVTSKARLEQQERQAKLCLWG